MNADRHRPSVADRLQLALGAAGLAASSIAAVEALRSLQVRPEAAHRVDLAGRLAVAYPAMDAAAVVLFTLGALGAAVVLAALRAACAQVRAHRRLVRELPIDGRLPSDPEVGVVRLAEPIAFCAGWLRPRIYVSSAAVERLSEPELQAVLAHERHHRASRDPLRLAAGRVLRDALFFLPVLRPLQDRAGNVAELRADAVAVTASRGEPGPLASAMLALAATPGGDTVGIAPERVDALLGQPPAWRPPWLRLAAALVTLGSFAVLIWRASDAASARASLGIPVVTAPPCVFLLAVVAVVYGIARALSRRR